MIKAALLVLLAFTGFSLSSTALKEQVFHHHRKLPNVTAGWLPRRLGGWLHSEHRLPSLQQVDAQTLGICNHLLPAGGWRLPGGSVL